MAIFNDPVIKIICIIFGAVIGAVFGSFLNCAAFRIAEGKSFLKGHSACPVCGHELGVLDLVPIFSWLFLRGKCRYCKTKISVRYPLTELCFALITVLCILRFGLTVLTLRNWLFFCFLFTLSLVDLQAYIIPDGCIIGSILVWLAALPFLWTGIKDAGFQVLYGVIFGGGALLISLVMDKILKKDSLGGGDIKLLFVMGLYLSLVTGLFALIMACITGLVFILISKGKKEDEEGHIPFGPFIAVGTAFMLLYGHVLVNWYLSLF